MVAKTPISIVTAVKNEEEHISSCLKTLTWADEVFVVDSQSTDRTVELAESLGANVVQFHFNGAWPKKFNWSLDNLAFRNGWIMIVSADERVSEELAQEVAEVIRNPAYDAYYIRHRYHFMGRSIRHGVWGNTWQLRLFRRGRAWYEHIASGDGLDTGDVEVHEHMVHAGRAGHLKMHLDHYPYCDISRWVEKHNRYSNWEAMAFARFTSGEFSAGVRPKLFGNILQRRRWIKCKTARLPLRPWLRFLHSYVFKFGFLDGTPGYVLARLMAVYETLSWAKRLEQQLRRQKRRGSQACSEGSPT